MKHKNLSEYKSILKEYWGYDDFRATQKPIIENISMGKNTLAILPTGGGKSICYQVPALAFSGLTIVISPLIALMIDQVNSLTEKNIFAAALYGSMSKSEQNEIINSATHGELKLLYISPERLTSKSFLEALPKMKVELIAIDEAHCISQWGHDFRPAYRNINSLRNLFPKACVLAVTATATQNVQQDILENLELLDAEKVIYPSRRKNLSYQVIPTENKSGLLHTIVLAHEGESGIIYARSRKLVAKITQYLKKRKVKAAAYHAGLAIDKKSKNQKDWIEGKIKIMVATNAFGMGIDKSDVRFVVHFDLAPNLEEYTQEAGRAGRDGKACKAIILLDKNDVEEKKRDIEKSYPPEHLIKDTYKSLASQFNLGIGEFMPVAQIFHLIEFCQSYGLPTLPTFYALKILDKMGYILLTDSFYQASEVQCFKEQFDAFNQSESFGFEKEVLDKILRIYDGVFYKQVKIDETYLASKLNATIDDTKEALEKLHSNGVVAYRAGGNSPQLKIRGARRHRDAINILPQIYKLRKEDAYNKLDSLEAYLNAQECRQIIIDRYFGFDKMDACKICDICLAQIDDPHDDKFLENKLIAILKTDKTELNLVMAEFSKNEQRQLIQLLERMESNKIISIISNHIILER